MSKITKQDLETIIEDLIIKGEHIRPDGTVLTKSHLPNIRKLYDLRKDDDRLGIVSQNIEF